MSYGAKFDCRNESNCILVTRPVLLTSIDKILSRLIRHCGGIFFVYVYFGTLPRYKTGQGYSLLLYANSNYLSYVRIFYSYVNWHSVLPFLFVFIFSLRREVCYYAHAGCEHH